VFRRYGAFAGLFTAAKELKRTLSFEVELDIDSSWFARGCHHAGATCDTEDSNRYVEMFSRSHLITLSDVATALCAIGERGLRMPCYDAPQGRGYSIYETASSEFVGGTSSLTRTANKGRS